VLSFRRKRAKRDDLHVLANANPRGEGAKKAKSVLARDRLEGCYHKGGNRPLGKASGPAIEEPRKGVQERSEPSTSIKFEGESLKPTTLRGRPGVKATTTTKGQI